MAQDARLLSSSSQLALAAGLCLGRTRFPERILPLGLLLTCTKSEAHGQHGGHQMRLCLPVGAGRFKLGDVASAAVLDHFDAFPAHSR